MYDVPTSHTRQGFQRLLDPILSPNGTAAHLPHSELFDARVRLLEMYVREQHTMNDLVVINKEVKLCRTLTTVTYGQSRR